jgi:hypothetical protein
MNYVDIYSLVLGDIFMEDGLNVKYQVVGFEKGKYKNFSSVLAENLSTGEMICFGYAPGHSAYAPRTYLF